MDNRRLQILHAAMACFAKRGVHPTTIRNIGTAAKLSAGAIYVHFRSKEEIVAGVTELGQEMARRTLSEAEAAGDPLSTLHAVIERFSRLFSRQHAFYAGARPNPTPEVFRRMNVMLWAEALRNPKIMKILAENYRKLHAQVTEIVTAAQRAGQISIGVDPLSVTQALNSLFIGLEVQIGYRPELDVKAYVHTAHAMLGNLKS